MSSEHEYDSGRRIMGLEEDLRRARLRAEQAEQALAAKDWLPLHERLEATLAERDSLRTQLAQAEHDAAEWRRVLDERYALLLAEKEQAEQRVRAYETAHDARGPCRGCWFCTAALTPAAPERE